MAESSIEWTDRVWNPVAGCTPVSPGCLNCYAARMARRLEGMGKAGYGPRPPSVDEVAARHANGITTAPSLDKAVRIAEVRGGRAVFTGDVRMLPERLGEPLKWRKPARVFVNSMSDLFHEAVPFEFVDRVFAVMALCPQHTFQVLTKRPERMAEYLGRVAAEGTAPVYDAMPGDAWMKRECRKDWAGRWPLSNVWLGTSVENQDAADERIPHLLRCPAAVRFLSCEPLLGPVELRLKPWTLPEDGRPVWERIAAATDEPRIDWVIAGGESGPNARGCEIDDLRSLRDQCKAVGVPFFLKQVGASPWVPCSCTAEDDGSSDPACSRCNGYGIVEVNLKNKKGGDPAEWLDDLRVREMPKERGAELLATRDATRPESGGAGGGGA